MATDEELQAKEKLQQTIDFECRFPDNVFRGQWSGFLFFDPDRIFDRAFPSLARGLLSLEGANSICMCERHKKTVNAPEIASFFFLNEQTTNEAYISFVAKEWIYYMDRFCLISDVARWCVYTERALEFAVLAIRDLTMLESAKPLADKLGALPFRSALENPPSYGLTSRGLTQEWRRRLLEAYGSHL